MNAAYMPGVILRPTSSAAMPVSMHLVELHHRSFRRFQQVDGHDADNAGDVIADARMRPAHPRVDAAHREKRMLPSRST